MTTSFIIVVLNPGDTPASSSWRRGEVIIEAIVVVSIVKTRHQTSSSTGGRKGGSPTEGDTTSPPVRGNHGVSSVLDDGHRISSHGQSLHHFVIIRSILNEVLIKSSLTFHIYTCKFNLELLLKIDKLSIGPGLVVSILENRHGGSSVLESVGTVLLLPAVWLLAGAGELHEVSQHLVIVVLGVSSLKYL